MKKILLLLALGIIVLGAEAQNQFTKFELSGFDVTIIPSETYSVKLGRSTRVVRSTVDGVLSLHVEKDVEDKSGKRPQLKIYTDRVEQLDLTNCLLNYQDAKTDALVLNLSGHSQATITGLKANSLSTTVDSGAKLKLTGATTKMDCIVKGASEMKSAGLLVDDLKLNISGASKTAMKIEARTVFLTAKFAADIKLEGTAEVLKSYTDMAVMLDATKLVTESGNVKTDRGCLVKVNVKKMTRNPEVDNVYDMKKKLENGLHFEDLF